MPGLTAETAALLHRATAGNPLALLELAADPGDLALAPEGAPVLVSAKISQAFLHRAGQLSQAAQQALVLAAASDTTDLATLQQAAAGLGIDLAALADAESAGLVALLPGTVEFRHPLARSAIYADASPGQRRDAHRALAAALPDRDVDRRAWHLAAAAAGTDDAASAALEQAGAGPGSQRVRDRARRVRAGREARRRRRAARPAAAGGGRGGVAGRAGRPSRGAAGRGARRDRRRSGRWSRSTSWRATSRPAAGPVMRGHAILTAAAGQRRPERAVAMLAEAAGACFYAGNPAEMLVVAERARALLPPARRRARGSWPRSRSGWRGSSAGTPPPARRRSTRRSRSPRARPNCVTTCSWCHGWRSAPMFLRETGAGRSLLDDALRAARDRAAVGALPYVLNLIARDQATTDRWAVAEATYREAIDLARESGQQTELAFGLAGTGVAAGPPRARARVPGRARPRRSSSAASSGRGCTRSGRRAALGELELGLGDAARAAEHSSASSGCWASWRSPTPTCRRGGADRRLPAARPRRRGAGGRRRSSRPRREAKGQPWSLARALRCQGLLAADAEFAGTSSGAAPARADARTRSRRRGPSWPTASACGGRGTGCWPASSSAPPRRHSSVSMRGPGPTGRAPSSRRPARRSGARDPGTIDELTPQELQIALLLAGGKDDPGGGGGAVPQPQDRRVPPAARVPEARHPLPRGTRPGPGRPSRQSKPALLYRIMTLKILVTIA